MQVLAKCSHPDGRRGRIIYDDVYDDVVFKRDQWGHWTIRWLGRLLGRTSVHLHGKAARVVAESEGFNVVTQPNVQLAVQSHRDPRLPPVI